LGVKDAKFYREPMVAIFRLALVFIGLCVLAYLHPAWRENRWAVINVVASLVTAAAAVSIPLVLNRNARETRTLELLNEANHTIGTAAADKARLDAAKQKSGTERFQYAYISSEPEVRSAVYRILNEYDYVCLGGNENLFSNTIIRRLRWDALDKTWNDYHEYILAHRNSGPAEKEAWIECDLWLKQNPRH
jgi:hypothetical protein